MTARPGLAACAVLSGASLLAAGTSSVVGAGSSGWVFRGALRIIQNWYVEEVDLEETVLDGLRSLSAIDPEIAVEQEAGSLVLRLRDDVVLRKPAPGARDAARWGKLIESAIEELQERSAPVGAADPDEIQRVVFKGIQSKIDSASIFVADVEEVRRNLGGIGVVLRNAERPAEVLSVLPGSPAQSAGIRPGDVLAQVDARSTSGLALEEVLDLLTGEPGSEISVTLQRPGEGVPVSMTLTRAGPESVGIFSVLEDGILHLRPHEFSVGTPGRIEQEIGDAIETGLVAVILDLRSSPGGLLRSGVEVADYFLPEGRIGSVEGARKAGQNVVFESDRNHLSEDVRVALLINGSTTGAAEVVAAALQDGFRAVIIGSASRGKRTVQTVFPLSARAAISLTTAYLHTAGGRRLEGRGVIPDLCTSAGVAGPKQIIGALAKEADRPGAASPDAASPREACPPSETEPDVDLDVARALLRDPALYRRAVR